MTQRAISSIIFLSNLLLFSSNYIEICSINMLFYNLYYENYQFLDLLPPITKTIQVRRTRHAGHCWGSRDELIRDVLLWTPTHGRAKGGRPARTYIQQLCEDTGCCPEDLPRDMNDREEWRERVRDICATSAIWWWVFLCYHPNDLATNMLAHQLTSAP